jgi:hypothetical protein
MSCRDEASLLQLIDNYWNDDVHECQVQRTERDYLFHELHQVRREVLEADEHLTKLVFQATRQAYTQMQRDSQTMDIIQLGKSLFVFICTFRHHVTQVSAASIGPDAVAYTEERHGGLQDFLDGQKHPTIFIIDESKINSLKVGSYLC